MTSPPKNTQARPIRVLLGDDHAMFRDALKLLLASHGGFDVVAEISDLGTLKQITETCRPDLLLLDYYMPGGDTSALVSHLKCTHPGLRIVVLTGSRSSGVLRQLVEAQADGVLLKDGSGAELITQLRAVMAGERRIPPLVADLIEQSDHSLTRREMQIVKLICDGHTNSDMAALLSLSPKTVDKHRENLMRKLQVSSVVQLIRQAHALGLAAAPNLLADTAPLPNFTGRD